MDKRVTLIYISKCAAVSLSRKLQPTSCFHYIDGMAIPCFVDRGISVANGLSFKPHDYNIVSKARQCPNTLLCRLPSRSLSTMILYHLNQSRLRNLEYYHVLWNPCLIHLTDLIENVQPIFEWLTENLLLRILFCQKVYPSYSLISMLSKPLDSTTCALIDMSYRLKIMLEKGRLYIYLCTYVFVVHMHLLIFLRP